MSTSSPASVSLANRRARRTCVAAGAAAIVVYFLARVFLERQGALSPPARVAVALAPAPFFLFFLAAQIGWLRRLDELERRKHLEALALAFPAVVLLLVVLGLLELAGVPLSRADWSYRHVWQIALVLYVAGLAAAHRRYR